MFIQKHQVRWLLLLSLGLLLPLLIQSSVTWAQNSDSEPNPMVVAYAKDFNLTYEEAERRLGLQEEMSVLEQQVIAGEPTYAGSWMQHQPEFGLVVAFTTPNGQELMQKYLVGIEWADLVEVRQLQYTVDELVEILGLVNQAARTTGVPFESGTNIPASKITLYTPNPDGLRSGLEAQTAMQEYMDEVEIVYQAALSVFNHQEDKPDSMVESYAETIGISLEEAERRLKLQEEMSRLEEQVIDGEPTYAGSWMRHEPDFGLTIAFTSADGEEIIKKYLAGASWADLVTVQQSPFTIDEFLDILNQVDQAAKETGIRFESGTEIQTSKVILYSPEPEKLRSELEAQGKISQYLENVNFVYQEALSSFFEAKYPYLPGGWTLSNCTTGYAVKRNSDGRRFMLTAGHCPNDMTITYGSVDSVYLGPTVYELNGQAGAIHDLQMHDVGVRSLDLTNEVFLGGANWLTVTGVKTKATTMGNYVCKYGRTTGYTCGYVSDLYFLNGRYVKADRPIVTSYDISCPGDSGGPVFGTVNGVTSALGTVSGGPHVGCWTGANTYMFYTPVDEVTVAGFTILTSPYKQYYLLNVWTGTTCTEYKTPIDDNGNLVSSQQTSQPCLTSLPTSSSGIVQSYNAYVLGQNWREGIWRGRAGYTRTVPLNSDGSINWSAAPTWGACCSGGSAPLAQEGKIVGNHFYLNVFNSNGTCTEYKTPIDNNGNPIWLSQTSQACRTFAPSSGTVQSYNSFVLWAKWREGIWRNGNGYVRTVPLNIYNTDVNYSVSPTPAWSSCCSGATAPDAQGGDILTLP